VEATTLTALSPLDGRYAGKATPLRRYLSEYALIRYRVLVEIRWLQQLADEPAIVALPPLQPAVKDVLNELVDEFSTEDAHKIKAHEAVTNHDVKAVEYFIRDKTQGLAAAQDNLIAFIHFACTSEDINNLAYAMMLRDVRKHVLAPQLKSLITDLRLKAHRHADLPMLSRTHGQSASPTTLGKELANFVARLERQLESFNQVEICGKLNGAVGNFNAHRIAYPDADWLAISERFVSSLGLHPQGYTTQIDPHDWIAEYAQALIRTNTVLIDLCRDIWGYVSLGYFRSRPADGEVGSSTMPHKVNPIDFENAEGNCGVANALLEHLAAKLPISRWQRDLSDSTVLRTLGLAIGHGYIAVDSALRGLGKLEVDAARIAADLEPAWEVLAEAIQTVLRAHGINDAYEQLKSLTRGRPITRETLHEFIRGTSLPAADRKRLLALEPSDYIGYAAELARNV
jgi:adenylosuccinate lyase